MGVFHFGPRRLYGKRRGSGFMDFGWAHLTVMARARDDVLRSWLWDGFYEVYSWRWAAMHAKSHCRGQTGVRSLTGMSTGAVAAQSSLIILVWPRCSQLRRFTNRTESFCAHFVLEASFFLVGNNPLFLTTTRILLRV